MKKLLIIICLFIVICFFIFNMKIEDNERKIVNGKREDRGIFISYIDLGKYIKNEDSDISKKKC